MQSHSFIIFLIRVHGKKISEMVKENCLVPMEIFTKEILQTIASKVKAL
jgi:hypothetical protein